jgi:starch synthase
MKVLLAASEVAPIIKIGGLGDVIGSLPKALEKIGVNADVIVPFYPTAKTENLKLYKVMDLNVPFDNANHVVEIFKTKLPDSNVDVLLLKNAKYFSIGGASAFLNNEQETEMFAFFGKSVVEYVKSQFNTYDVIHCHDWHTGFLTHLLQEELHDERPATVFTIHNLFYQGTSSPDLVREAGIPPGTHPIIDYDIQDGDLNLLFQGVASSDYITTVSETYAEEIKTEEFGQWLAPTLKSREDVLSGIINGIDYSFFPREYDLDNWSEKKAMKKKALQEELNLETTDKPIFGFVSRLDPGQKGLDILYVSIPHILDNGGQFVLLGTGAKDWEAKFADLMGEKKYQGDISINIKFNVELANKIYCGSDFFFVPSRYEPCGLTQMIAMHYGTPPIVRAVGGLKDTVDDGKDGIVFNDYSSLDLNKAIDRALKLYQDKETYGKMVENAMEKDFSWKKSAQKYKELYEKVVNSRK